MMVVCLGIFDVFSMAPKRNRLGFDFSWCVPRMCVFGAHPVSPVWDPYRRVFTWCLSIETSVPCPTPR